MKLTTKTTKEQLKTFLGVNASAVKKADKDLYDELVYADKMLRKDEKKVTRKDLMDLAKAVTKVLGDKIKTPSSEPLKVVAETSVKKKAPKEEVVIEMEVPKDTATEKKSKGKLTKKKTQPKKKEDNSVKAIEKTNNDKLIQMAELFPKTLAVGDAKYELTQEIKSMDDLYNALDNDEEIVFAFYWSKRHLKQFSYYSGLLGQPKSFDMDLDLTTPMYISEEKKVVYFVSMYTEALYAVVPQDLEEIDGVRIAGGIEYQIYKAV